jgi:type IV pilus assembly protein PilO
MALRDYKFENLSPTVQLAVFLALILVLGGAFYSLYLREMVEERDALKTEVDNLETSVAQATAVENQLKRFKQELAQLEQRLAALREVLPADKETPSVLRSVQEMASDSRLKILKFNPKPVVPRAFYSDFPILVEVQGNYNALGGFFEKIGGFARIINVGDINIKGVQGSSNPALTLSATCTATTFVFMEETVTGTVK